MEIGLALLTETKLTDERYTRYSSGYRVVATRASSAHKGGVAFVWKESISWHMESIVAHGHDVLSGVLVSGQRRWQVIGVYIPPSADGVGHTTQVLHANQRYPRLPRILLGDLNFDLDQPAPDPRSQAIAATLAEVGVTDLGARFQPRRRFCHRQTWRMNRSGGWISGRCDYLMVDDNRPWKSCRLVKPRGFATDHLMIMATLVISTGREHGFYTRGRRQPPFRIGQATAADRAFWKLVKNRQALPRRARPARAWISEETWRLVDRRAERRRTGRLHG